LAIFHTASADSPASTSIRRTHVLQGIPQPDVSLGENFAIER